MAMDNKQGPKAATCDILIKPSSCSHMGCVHNVSPSLACKTNAGGPRLCLVSTIRPESRVLPLATSQVK